MAREKTLKAALDRHKGVNHKLEHQKKLQKLAEKRKRAKKAPDQDGADIEQLRGGLEELLEAEAIATDPNKSKKVKKAANKAEAEEKLNGEADGWETDGSEGVEDEDDDVEVVGAMEDESDSDSEDEVRNFDEMESLSDANDDDEDDEDANEGEDDIPLSDIESLASEDRADVIPHQRLTINNTAALQRSLKSIALPSSLPFSAIQSITSDEPVQIPDVDDDLNRELAFYRQSLNAVSEARKKLKKEGVPFSRPADYFAEMVKSEEQMGKVKQKLVDEAARKKASADARRQRDLKKFGKAVQVAKLQERQKEKTKTLDRISTLKRSKSCSGVGLRSSVGLTYRRTTRRRSDGQRRRHVRRRARRRCRYRQSGPIGAQIER